MSKQIAVLISDIHYNNVNLPVADAAMRIALKYAEDRQLPFIVAGDLHDTKANLRGECVNAMIKLFKDARTYCTVIVGNHCMLNERGTEHALHFLAPYMDIVQCPVFDGITNSFHIPYFNDSDALLKYLSKVPKGSRLIMHQGVQGAAMGDYVLDKTSLPREAYADFRVISGHYHRAQDIKCGPPRKGAVGLFSYIGSPYTTSFGEANDGPKGFRVLNEDGILDFVPTGLRKHVIIETECAGMTIPKQDPKDLVWVKLHGTRAELAKVKKNQLLGYMNYKLDLIPTDAPIITQNAKITGEQAFDNLIDNSGESVAQSEYLKKLWREVIETR